MVEADGPLHEGPERRAHDLQRDRFFQREGFHVLRFGQDAILADLARVVEAVRSALGPKPSPDP